jgi:hypothetical protein
LVERAKKGLVGLAELFVPSLSGNKKKLDLMGNLSYFWGSNLFFVTRRRGGAIWSVQAP